MYPYISGVEFDICFVWCIHTSLVWSLIFALSGVSMLLIPSLLADFFNLSACKVLVCEGTAMAYVYKN